MTVYPVPKPTPRGTAAKRDAEFRRTYHSDERVRWVQRQPCMVCGVRPSENAHVGSKGKGTSRKADFDQVAPLCTFDHDRMHRGKLLVDRGTRAAWAAETERRWREYSNAR